MITEWKAGLRAWLIDLVREAIKLETKQSLGITGVEYSQSNANSGNVADIPNPRLRPIRSTPIVSEPSFEQMQAEAIQEQEKYYEPRQD